MTQHPILTGIAIALFAGGAALALGGAASTAWSYRKKILAALLGRGQ